MKTINSAYSFVSQNNRLVPVDLPDSDPKPGMQKYNTITGFFCWLVNQAVYIKGKDGKSNYVNANSLKGWVEKEKRLYPTIDRSVNTVDGIIKAYLQMRNPERQTARVGAAAPVSTAPVNPVNPPPTPAPAQPVHTSQTSKGLNPEPRPLPSSSGRRPLPPFPEKMLHPADDGRPHSELVLEARSRQKLRLIAISLLRDLNRLPDIVRSSNPDIFRSSNADQNTFKMQSEEVIAAIFRSSNADQNTFKMQSEEVIAAMEQAVTEDGGDKGTVLHYLTSLKLFPQRESLIEQAVSQGADINDQQNTKKMTPLHFVLNDAETECPALMAFQYKQGCYREVNDIALLTSDLPFIKKLLDLGAKTNLQDADGNTPLHLAAYSLKDLQTIDLLLSHGADLNAVNQQGHTPLSMAIKKLLASGGDDTGKAIVENLQKRGAKIADPSGELLKAALENWIGHTTDRTKKDLCEFFLKNGGNLELADPNGELLKAALENWIGYTTDPTKKELCEFFVKHGRNLQLADPKGKLLKAALKNWMGHTTDPSKKEPCEFLTRGKRNISQIDPEAKLLRSAIEKSLQSKNDASKVEVIRFLIENGADPQTKYNDKTISEWASQQTGAHWKDLVVFLDKQS